MSLDTYYFTILFIYSTPYAPESPITNFLNQLESAYRRHYEKKSLQQLLSRGRKTLQKGYLSIIPVIGLPGRSFFLWDN
jgi:hypothetical protein